MERKITDKSSDGLREIENSSGMRHAIGNVRSSRDSIRDRVSRLQARVLISAKYEIDRKTSR